MSIENIYKSPYANEYGYNKYIWENETDKNSDKAKQANARNGEIRKTYDVGADTMNFEQYKEGMAYAGNDYINTAAMMLKKSAENSKYTKKQSSAVSKIKNFSYNPDDDPVYEAYKLRYQREAETEADKMYSKLSKYTNGQNNSWATVATAQVGNEYAKKITDIIPELARDSFEREVSKYELEAQEEERLYRIWQENYNRNYELANKIYNIGMDKMDNFQNYISESLENDKKREQLKQNVFENELYREYEPSNLRLEQLINETKLDTAKSESEIKKKELEWFDTQKEYEMNKYNLEAERIQSQIKNNIASVTKKQAEINKIYFSLK